MEFSDIMDPSSLRRIERDHDAFVSDEAYEVHVAEVASTPLERIVASQPRGSQVTVRLRQGDVLRGSLQDPTTGWVTIDLGGRRVLVALRAVTRVELPAVAVTAGTCPALRTLGSVLREHARAAGAVCVRLTDGVTISSSIRAVGADFVALGDGSLVPFSGMDVCELR